MSEYADRFYKRLSQLTNEQGMSTEKALDIVHKELGPDPDQPNIDGPILNAGIKIGATILFSKFKTWVPLIGSAAWGAVFILKAFGKITAASSIESFLTLLNIQPQLSPVDYTGLATGIGAGIKFYKMYQETKVPKV